MLARRDTRREAARGRRLPPLQTVEDQSPAWGICCHSCTWREGFAPSWRTELHSFWLCGLPEDLGPLSTNGSHFNEGSVDLPAAGRQHVLDPLERAEDHAVLHLYQTAPPYGLDDLGIEEPGQGHPTGLGSCPCGLTAGGLYPLPIDRPPRRRILLESVRQE